MRAVLTITGGPQCDRQWPLHAEKALTLGRGSQADVVLLDSEVSRLHCTISCAEGSWRVEDRGSLNGTFVNGEKVAATRLRHGDRIRVGSTILRIDIAAEPREPAPPPAAEAARCARCGRPLSPGSATCPVCDTQRVAAYGTEITPPRVREPRAAARPGFAAPKVVRVEHETTVQEFVAKHRRDASNVVLAWWQFAWYALVVAALALLLVYDYLYFLHIVHLVCTFYLVVIAYKLATVVLSVLRRWEITITPNELAALRPEQLPPYTILVPLYMESEVVDKIVRYVAELDYPRDKLDVKILLEPDDPQTMEAIRATGLPDFCEVIVCPPSSPKTKPKACNHGLARARGEFLTIYDAEDRPEPDQLKKAVIAFGKADAAWQRRRWLRRLNPFRRSDRGRTVCLQAKLNYYNPRQNLLTRWFTVEYVTWFQLYLPGLHAVRAPIPLGGTSNHFRADVLRDIGGWDPFNVTEDCDLGVRIHKRGFRTQVVDSTTWEEANSRLPNWLRQRSRWVKGYLQTHFTHMRHPLRTIWRLRPWGAFNFLNSVGGLSAMLLLNPIFWITSLIYVGLFTADLRDHGWSVEQALGVDEAFRDAADKERNDRTIRLPHPDRRAWPIICGARPEPELPPDFTWKQRVWLALKEDWVCLWRGTPSALSAPAAEGSPRRSGSTAAQPELTASRWRELWANRGWHFWNIASQVLFVCTLALVLGNVFFVLMHVVACLRARMPALIPFALLMPFYWVLISLGAWKGFLQLARRPFYWEKTRHGLDVKRMKGAQ